MSIVGFPPRVGRGRTGLGSFFINAAITAAFAVVLGLPHPGHAAPNDPAVQAAILTDGLDRPLASPPVESSEPFGRLVADVTDGPLVDKWQGVKHTIEAEMALVMVCRANVAFCPSPAALEFVAIVDRARMRDGLARAGEINRAINLDIRPVSDVDQYQVEDVWSSPLVSLATHAGDCEDYAIAKLVALREAGMAAQDLRLVILRDKILREDHAVVAARVDGRWRVLDSRRFLMLEDTQFTRFQPIFAIDETGIKRYEDVPQVSASTAPVHPYF